MSHVSSNISIQTFGEFKKSHKLPIFIKPYQSVKANDLKDSQNYASGVITKESSISFYSGMPDDYLVMTSDVVNFVSEYRCFVNRGEIKGIKWYNGDFKRFIDPTTVELIMKLYTNSPISYTIDVGLLENGKTTLIECNDGWSVSDYGLEPELYFRFLVDRWKQIVG